MAIFRRLSVLVAVLATMCCGGLLNPEAGDPLPVDPGTILVRVLDQNGAPVRDVYVEIGNIPNHVGSTFSEGQWTHADGTTTFDSIDAGDRTVTVTPPSGFAADASGNTRHVTVVKAQTTTVVFQLVKA